MKRPLQTTLEGQLVVHPLASWLSTKILHMQPKTVDNQLAWVDNQLACKFVCLDPK